MDFLLQDNGYRHKSAAGEKITAYHGKRYNSRQMPKFTVSVNKVNSLFSSNPNCDLVAG